MIDTTAHGGLKILPAIDKRGPEHAIGEHHVSIAIWGKPGDVGEPPVEPTEQIDKDVKKQLNKEHKIFNRFNSGKQLVDDVGLQYRSLM